MDILIIYLLIELLANITIFPLLNKSYKMTKQDGEVINPKIKGVSERLCLVIGGSIGVPHVLVAYGALKIGTKLGGQSGDSREKKHTEYYLIGNLVSITVAFLIVYLSDKIPITGIDLCEVFTFINC